MTQLQITNKRQYGLSLPYEVFGTPLDTCEDDPCN